MTPDRWDRVKEILQQAWECDAADRAQVLDQLCVHDPALRAEVEAILGADGKAGEFLSQAIETMAGAGFDEPAAIPDSGRRIGPYRVLREIGHGGMGTVYLAERADGQYRKRVAIKLVNPHLGTENVLRRFRNERQVLAALNHPNIAQLLDGGATEDGLPFLVMEYVEGVPIDTWCNSDRLAARDRVRLFRKVCDAVQYAHEQQVVHRDIKPGNILVDAEGTPQLLDFGIAKVLNPELSALTIETTMGPGPMTPGYASPEQVRGEPLGPASDIYALGVVLYQLLTGRLPYLLPGQDLRQMAALICDQEPAAPNSAIVSSDDRAETPTSLRRLLAGDLDNIVLKTLRREPERRYRSAAQLSEDLHRFLQDLPVQARKESLGYRGRKFLKRNRALVLTAAASSLIVLALAAGFARLRAPAGLGSAGMRSIAVLPLENLSGDKEQEYFSDGITDALIGDLARSPDLRVISRTSVMSYKNVRKPMPEIARTLGVRTIAEGSVLRAGNHIRITVRLIDAPTDRPVWSGNYEGELNDVLALQRQVADAIAGEIQVTLTRPSRSQGPRDQRVNLNAYEAYLKGRHQYFTLYTRESTENAIAWFRQALEFDPTYAPAYAGLADCYWGLSSTYDPPNEVMPKARWAAMKAIELDDTLGEAHGLLGMVRSAYEFRRAEAGKEFERAIELKPGDAQVHLLYGIHLAEMRQFDAADAQLDQAQKLDPVSPFVNSYVALPLYFARRYDQIVQRMLPLIEMGPGNQQTHAFLGLALEQKAEWAKAIAELETVDKLDENQDGLAQLGHIYALSGRTADARRILGRLREMSRQHYVSAYNLGVLYAGLGERDEAFRWFQRVDQDRSEWFGAFNVDPRLDELRTDPRFGSILRSVGLKK